MKSFLQLIEEKEATHKPVVMAFGRMNPPTTGHLKLIDKVKSEAEKRKVKHVVVVSHSHDAKKNPLSTEQKLKHLKRYSPGTHFEASSKEHPTIIHQAEKLHKAGHDHLVVVAGSDRVKEYHDLLHKYNGKADKEGHVPYHFKKIDVVSAGHRDPDAEGAEGMSGTKMREHAKNNDFSSFKQGVPSHVSNEHAKELMHDVRKGMGLHEEVNRGKFKAIFVTGGPGSGKDIVIRESIAENRAVELNTIQAYDYLADKSTLFERSNDFRKEAIRNRGPLIINGPAEHLEKILYIKEELEELAYDTFMIFVETTDEESKNRNRSHRKMMVEEIRHEKWLKSQRNKKIYEQAFNNYIYFDNTGSIETKEEHITDIYCTVNNFLDSNLSETALDWLRKTGKLNINGIFDRLIREHTRAPRIKKTGPEADTTIPPDNRAGTKIDNLVGNQNPRKDPNGKGHSGGAWSGAYSTEQAAPTISKRPDPKESNFSQDKDKIKKKKFGDKSLSAARVGKPAGIGQEYDTRAGGQGAAAGAGLGDQTYSEDYVGPTASNADVTDFGAIPRGVSPNPLNSNYNMKKNSFNGFKKKLKEYNGFQNDVESGVGGTLGGSGNVEKMDSYKDPNRNIGIEIKPKKNKKKQEK